MRGRWRAVRAVVGKDLRVALGSRAVTVPFVVVPVIFMFAMPLGVALLAPLAAAEAASVTELFESVSPALVASLEGLDDAQRLVVLGIVYMLAPLFLVVPLMVASVLAADSFAGEKERKTLEVLVYSPLSDGDLVLAKMLSAWLPAVVVGLGSFVVYALTANLAAWPVMGRVFVPNAMWLLLLAWVMPAAAAVGLGGAVIVSSRVNTFQEAYQLGGIVVLPIVGLVVAQAVGVIYFSTWLVAALGAVLWLTAAVLLRLGSRSLRRTELVSRL